MLNNFLLLNLNLPTLWALIQLEMKKLFTYQLEFWVSSVIYIPLQTFAAYFVWKAALGDLSCFGSYCFNGSQLVFYFLVAGFINRVQLRSEDMSTMFMIFNGQISKLLCYPISYWHFIGSKALVNLVYQAVILLAVLLAYSLFIPGASLTLPGVVAVAQSLSLVFMAILISKLGVCVINSSAFWIDRCGPILFSYMRVQTLLGGSLVPIFMIPEGFSVFVKMLPFYSMVEVPALLLVNGANFEMWLNAFQILSCWLLVYVFVCLKIWKRGLKNYAAVGI